MKNLIVGLHDTVYKVFYPYFFLSSLIFLSYQPILTKAEPLPPPPPLKVPSVPPTASPPPPTSSPQTTSQPIEVPVSSPATSSASDNNSPVREFTFQAPSNSSPALSTPSPSSLPSPPPSPSIPSPSSPSKTSFYRVEVLAADEGVLEKVRAIEPFAFWERKQQIVYAGRFHQKDQAQQRVEELSQKGLSAQIVPVSRENEPLNTVRPR